MLQTKNLRIAEFAPLVTPRQLEEELAPTEEIRQMVRRAARPSRPCCTARTSTGSWSWSGPCSIHDPEAAFAYAERLKKVADATREHLLIVMRTYFEKPRTVVGWKGLVSDPHLDGSCEISRVDPGAQDPAAHGCARPALRDGVPGYRGPALPLRHGFLGGHRRAHHGKPGPPANGQRTVHARRIQEQHRRCAAKRHQRHALRPPRARFSGHQRRRHLLGGQDPRQPRRAHRAARRRLGNQLPRRGHCHRGQTPWATRAWRAG
jgi:hypothetical protein